jgi:hypothetical protein
MITLLTPCCRQGNLRKMVDSINFEKIDKWIIIYDISRGRRYTTQFEGHPKIIEVFRDGGISGNPQRNHGIDLVTDGYIYFLDDDNIIHPNFWSIVDQLDNTHFYTFDQLRDNKSEILPGRKCEVNKIDTAMFLVHTNHIKETRWKENLYNADGYFISEVYSNNKHLHKYIPITACYYNFLR